MNIRLSLLWRTILLLSLFLIMSQILVYYWILRSVNNHFEVMDAEVLTHAAFNIRRSKDNNKALVKTESVYNYNSGMNYGIKVIPFNLEGELLLNNPADIDNTENDDTTSNTSSTPIVNTQTLSTLNLIELKNKHGDQQFDLKLDNRLYRSLMININNTIYLLALPIDLHHQYLYQFKWQLKLILFVITLLLVLIASVSVYWGFSPLTTFIQKMKSVNFEQLDERITVSDMPSELRPLADSYNTMMDKLEDNFDSLMRFSDNIAHELRTPIATLSTQTQVMLSKPRTTEEYAEQLHHQHDTLEQLSDVINNMLLLAKTQKGLTHDQLQNVDMEQLLTLLIEYYEWLAEDRGITLDKAGKFPIIKGDKGLIQRLFSNLISNAIYYSKSNSIIYIRSQVTKYDQNALDSGLSVFDITIENQMSEPMSQREANRLFERFYQHSSASHKINNKTSNSNFTHSGSGLGLSIVKSIVRAHGGTVSITVTDDNKFLIKVSIPAVS